MNSKKKEFKHNKKFEKKHNKKLKKDQKIQSKFALDCLDSPKDKRDFGPDCLAILPELPEEFCMKKAVPVVSQGSIGSCVAFATSTALAYNEYKFASTGVHNDYSKGFIYGNRKGALDYKGEGMYIRQALKNVNHYGDCLYNDFPWNETYPKVAKRIADDEEKYLELAKPYCIQAYYRCYTVEEIKTAILQSGAVICSINVYPGFGAETELPKSGEKSSGGHALCCIGWDKTGWIIQNSWGKYWGNKGFCHIPYEYPFKEWWGIQINPDAPKPHKDSLWKRILGWFNIWLKKLFK